MTAVEPLEGSAGKGDGRVTPLTLPEPQAAAHSYTCDWVAVPVLSLQLG